MGSGETSRSMTALADVQDPLRTMFWAGLLKTNHTGKLQLMCGFPCAYWSELCPPTVQKVDRDLLLVRLLLGGLHRADICLLAYRLGWPNS